MNRNPRLGFESTVSGYRKHKFIRFYIRFVSLGCATTPDVWTIAGILAPQTWFGSDSNALGDWWSVCTCRYRTHALPFYRTMHICCGDWLWSRSVYLHDAGSGNGVCECCKPSIQGSKVFLANLFVCIKMNKILKSTVVAEWLVSFAQASKKSSFSFASFTLDNK